MRKLSRVHFMTSYVEYLLRSGIKNEDDHIGDVSRFLRYLLTQVSHEDIEGFFTSCNASDGYRRRLRRTLGRFFEYSKDHLEIEVRAAEGL